MDKDDINCVTTTDTHQLLSHVVFLFSRSLGSMLSYSSSSVSQLSICFKSFGLRIQIQISFPSSVSSILSCSYPSSPIFLPICLPVIWSSLHRTTSRDICWKHDVIIFSKKKSHPSTELNPFFFSTPPPSNPLSCDWLALTHSHTNPHHIPRGEFQMCGPWSRSTFHLVLWESHSVLFPDSNTCPVWKRTQLLLNSPGNLTFWLQFLISSMIYSYMFKKSAASFRDLKSPTESSNSRCQNGESKLNVSCESQWLGIPEVGEETRLRKRE